MNLLSIFISLAFKYIIIFRVSIHEQAVSAVNQIAVEYTRIAYFILLHYTRRIILISLL